MKPLTLLRVSFPFWLSLTTASAAIAPTQSEPAVVERGAHHNLWNWTVPEAGTSGRMVNRVHSYTELSSGLNYWSEEQRVWLPSKDEIEIINGFAVARQGQHQTIWAPNAHTAGAFDMQMLNGNRLRGHVLALAFTSRKTGESFLFAQTKDCQGEVAGTQVIYRDAFDGCSGNIVYTWTREKFEQDILLTQALPDPSQAPWNLDPNYVMVEVFTELIDPPQPIARTIVLKSETDPALRQQMVEPDIMDQQFDFGAMAIGAGNAFASDGRTQTRVPVAKRLAVVEGNRHILIERVEYAAIRDQLVLLVRAAPMTKERMANLAATIIRGKNGVAGFKLPPAATPTPAKNLHAMLANKQALPALEQNKFVRLTQVPLPTKGFVLDFTVVNMTSNVRFKADTTYYVSGNLTLSGTNILEGGTVIKYSPTNTALLHFYGPLVCLTSQYRPAVLTARDDHTVGENIGTNILSGYYASTALDLNAQIAGSGFNLQHLRIKYADTGINFVASGNVISHSQFLNCRYGYQSSWNPDVTFRNALFCSISNICNGSGSSTTTSCWEHVTLDQVQGFNADSGSTFFLTNCLLVAVTNTGDYSGVGNSSASDPSAVFQTVGGAAHYLIADSGYRNAGTTTIDPTLAKDLKLRTTYPPMVIAPSGWYTSNLTIFPQVQRDVDTPDLGYHYDPLDYAVQSIALSNATINILPGTAVAVFCTNAATYGFGLFYGAQLYSEGTPANPTRIVRFNTVQEGANSTWNGVAPYSVVTTWNQDAVAPTARFRFTDFSCLAREVSHFEGESTSTVQTYSFNDCQFHGGYFNLLLQPSICVTNCLFERLNCTFDDGGGVNAMTNFFRNCLFYGGSYVLYHSSAGWPVKDSFFHNLDFLEADGTFDADYNGYTTNSVRLGSGTHDVVLTTTNVTFETGSLGRFYLPSNSLLINAGSTNNASVFGFYHYTTLTNQSKELTNHLDISFHYVATTNGVPIDTDLDGFADYLEDWNGNGLVNSGETDWSSATDLGLRVQITRPANNSIIP